MHVEHVILLPVYKFSYFSMSENSSANIKLGVLAAGLTNWVFDFWKGPEIYLLCPNLFWDPPGLPFSGYLEFYHQE